jgi:CO/xanthine dehydrogenase FAD-binding subunit
VSSDPAAAYLAGGTTQLDLMKDGVLGPDRLVDITRLPLRGISRSGGAVRIMALTTMEELAADPTIRERLPVVREALLLSASVQLRNMATIAGNLLQRTRAAATSAIPRWRATSGRRARGAARSAATTAHTPSWPPATTASPPTPPTSRSPSSRSTRSSTRRDKMESGAFR